MEKSNSLSIICDETAGGIRIDKFLGGHRLIGSRSRGAYLIDRGLVMLNSKPTKSSEKLKMGDVIDITLPAPSETKLVPLEKKLDILFEDDDLIVINKPSGLVVHPAAGHAQDTLVNALLSHTSKLSMKFGENRPGVVHRLDKDTSGILVVAKNDRSHEVLAAQFKNKSVHRKYFSLVFGTPNLEAWKIQSYLSRHLSDRKKFASLKDQAQKLITAKFLNPPETGKWSITNVKVEQRLLGQLAYLSLVLETGRTHQIRVHLSEHRLPILADPIYWNRASTQKSEAVGFPRLALHAGELGFIHPTTGKMQMYKAQWPDTEKEILLRLGVKLR